MFTWKDRPVILAGHGLRSAWTDPNSILALGAPVLSSWQAADFFDNRHPNYFGRPGIWGQRIANKILFEADQIIALGNRMSVWNVGFSGIRPEHDLWMWDCDEDELKRWPQAKRLDNIVLPEYDNPDWIGQCDDWRAVMPWVEWHHRDTERFIHPWRFVDRLHEYLREDEIIVTDMGTALVAAHQVLRLVPPQRLMTSGGLGEMGCALPAAIGASFARNKSEVLCLHCDGGMMMNLQELQTIVQYQLPIKIIVFENAGYSMLKQTQDGAGYQRSGVSPENGVSFPSFRRLAQSFGMHAVEVWNWVDYEKAMPMFFTHQGPALLEYHMDPECQLLPKLLPIRRPDGSIESPAFWDMSPRLDTR